jgi:hypothetical protein
MDVALSSFSMVVIHLGLAHEANDHAASSPPDWGKRGYRVLT